MKRSLVPAGLCKRQCAGSVGTYAGILKCSHCGEKPSGVFVFSEPSLALLCKECFDRLPWSNAEGTSKTR